MNPLEQLADITAPTAVSIWPLAWGYWVVIALLLIACAAVAVYLLKYRKKKAVQRKAIVEMALLNHNDVYFSHKLQVIVKQTCMHYFKSELPQQLSGQAWQNFLLHHYQGKHASQLEDAIALLEHNLYADVTTKQETVDTTIAIKNLQAAMIDWVSTSTPPKLANAKNKLAVTNEVNHV